MDNNYNYNSRYTSTREKSSGMLGSPLPFALAMMVGGAAIFAIWYFFYAGSRGPSNQPVPIIKAEASPMKVKPDSAAQPEVPHQDKLVYGRVNPAEQSAGVERLLPPTEEPIDMSVTETSAPQNNDEGFPNPHIKTEDKADFRAEPLEQKPTPVAEHKSTTQQPSKVDPLPEAQFTGDHLPGTLVRDEPPVEDTAPEPTTKLASSSIPAQAKEKAVSSKTLQTGYRIQLASMKSQDQAKTEWRRLQNEHKSTLGGLNATYARVDLGAKKGIFYRVQAGDFASKADAQNACSQIKSQNANAGCLIVKF